MTNVTAYWSRDEQYYTPFYSKRNDMRSLLPHFSIPSFWKQWRPSEPWWPRLQQTLETTKDFDTLNNKFCELHNLTEHLAVDEVIMLYKGRVFRQNIPKKHKRFGIKIYKLCDSLGYTYDMSVYLGKQRQHATAKITAMHSMVLQVIRRVEGLGHKIFMDNYFTSPVAKWHKNFHQILVRKLIIHSQDENVTASGISRGRPSPAASHFSRLEVKHSQHWPSKGKQRRCRMCSLQK